MIKNFSEYKDYSKLVLEEISLGNVKSYPIKKEFYKMGDYICSSFDIDNREVVVTSVIVDDEDILQDPSSRHYKTLKDYLVQFKIEPNRYLNIGFCEYEKHDHGQVIPFEDINVNDTSTLFRKMATIIEISIRLTKKQNIEFVIINSIENDLMSGKKRAYNKRDKFYELFLNQLRYKYWFIKHNYLIHNQPLNNFYVIKV